MLLKSLVLISFFYSGALFALNTEFFPSCKYINILSDPVERSGRLATNGDDVVYQFEGTTETITYKELYSWKLLAHSSRQESNLKSFHRKMAAYALKNTIELKAPLVSSLPLALDLEAESNLEQCLNDKRKFKGLAELNLTTTRLLESEDRYLSLIESYIDDAMLVKSLWIAKEKEIGYAKHRLSELYDRFRFRLERGTQRKFYDAQVKAIEDSRDRVVAEIDMRLFPVLQRRPLLYNIENSISWLPFNYNIQLTPFLELLLDGLDPDFWEAVQTRLIAEGDVIALADLLVEENIQNYRAHFILEKLNDPRVKEAAKKSAESFISRVNVHAQSICESNKTKLHYNERMVHLMMKDNYLRDNEHFKIKTVKDLAGYCAVLNDDPPQTDRFLTDLQVIGISSTSAGGLLSFLLKKNNFSRALLWAGSSVIGYDIFQRYGVNELLLDASFSLAPQGLTSIQEYESYLNQRGSIILEGGLELGVGFAAYGGFRVLDRAFSKIVAQGYKYKAWHFPNNIWGDLGVHRIVPNFIHGKRNHWLLSQGIESNLDYISKLESTKLRLMNRRDWSSLRYRALERVKAITKPRFISKFQRLSKNGDVGKEVDALFDVAKIKAKDPEILERITSLVNRMKAIKSTKHIVKNYTEKLKLAFSNGPKYLAALKKIEADGLYQAGSIKKYRSIKISKDVELKNGRLYIWEDRFEDGLLVREKIRIDSYPQLSQRAEAADNALWNSFAATGAEGALNSSGVSIDIIEHAMNFRLGQEIKPLLLQLRRSNNILPEQSSVLNAIDRNVTRTNRPVSSVYNTVIQRQLMTESGEVLLGFLGRYRQQVQSRFHFMRDLDQLVGSVVGNRWVRRFALYGLAATGGSILLFNPEFIIKPGSWFDYQIKNSRYTLLNWSRQWSDFTHRERECASHSTKFRFLFCVKELALEETAYERAYNFNNPSYRLIMDKVVVDKISVLVTRLLILRKKGRIDENGTITDAFINSEEGNFAIRNFVNEIESRLKFLTNQDIKKAAESGNALADEEVVERKENVTVIVGLLNSLMIVDNPQEKITDILSAISTRVDKNTLAAIQWAATNRAVLVDVFEKEMNLPLELLLIIDGGKDKSLAELVSSDIYRHIRELKGTENQVFEGAFDNDLEQLGLDPVMLEEEFKLNQTQRELEQESRILLLEN
ncbi:MAG: hypothetical protein AB8E15_02110 [Bdellovibrionales bacterium]